MIQVDTTHPILVTGASGYIASWIIRMLLGEGCTVHGTVRDLKKASSIDHLKKMANELPGELKLFKADLLQPGSFSAAMQGCEVVIHTASPFLLSVKDPQRDLVDPALKGTENVLSSVNKVSTVRRVVLTSSVAAIYGDAMDLGTATKFDESFWNTTSSVKHQPYSFSKVLAERRAWDLQKEQSRWDLVTINPGAVWGPSLTSSSQSGSIDILRQMGDGRAKMGLPNLELGMVDVRDVAQAHIAAAFLLAANGRYITCAKSLNFLEISEILQTAFQNQFPFPKKVLPKWLVWLVAPTADLSRKFVSRNVGYPLPFDNSRSVQELEINYRNEEETFVSHFRQLIEDGLV
jgi:nucleoside-diphosphate-sugar epimerase